MMSLKQILLLIKKISFLRVIPAELEQTLNHLFLELIRNDPYLGIWPTNILMVSGSGSACGAGLGSDPRGVGDFICLLVTPSILKH
jgi:hypothetical protein